MKVNSIRSSRGYPRQISLKSTKASNKPLCFHDFGKIPLCQLQEDLLAHHDSHPRCAVKHNALLICCFFLLLTAKSVHRQDIVTEPSLKSGRSGCALLWHTHFSGLRNTFANSSNTKNLHIQMYSRNSRQRERTLQSHSLCIQWCMAVPGSHKRN